MAYNPSSLVTLSLLKTVTTRVKAEYTQAIKDAMETTNIASDEEVQEMLTEVFDSEDPEVNK